MENVLRRGKAGTFYVKKDIPADVRLAFGGKAQIWKSLGTSNKHEAARLAAPILAELDRNIAKARGQAMVEQPPKATPRTGAKIDPTRALEAIEQWRVQATQQAYEDHFNDAAGQPAWFSDDDVAWSQLVYALQQGRTDQIADFDETLANVLQDAGLPVGPTHPALTNLRRPFNEAWLAKEQFVGRFRRGEFEGWPEEGVAEPLAGSLTARPGGKGTQAPLKLGTLLEAFIKSQRPGNEQQVRAHVRRLTEFLGDPDVNDIDATSIDGFVVELRKYPNTKRPQVNNMTFSEVIAEFTNGPRLSAKTVWKWMSSLKRFFTYAVRMGHLAKNPVDGAMPKLTAAERKKRLRYDATDIGIIFSKPMFTGTVLRKNRHGKLIGYRDEPGAEVLRDACYWLPIFCLFHGTRVEEIGAARVNEIKQEPSGRWFLDLSERSVKTVTSKRSVPIHPVVVRLGFLRYLDERRKAADEYVFPELPHDPTGRLHSTRQFTKWWGYWCDANAKDLKATGFNDPRKSFHSLRHSFKRACREAKIEEEIHDLLTGHSNPSVGRMYGAGVSVETLGVALDRVRYETFPL